MTGETLLRYVRDGRLTAEKIGGKFYTTLFQVQNMKHMIVEEKQANTIDDKTNENNRIETFKRLREISNKRNYIHDSLGRET